MIHHNLYQCKSVYSAVVDINDSCYSYRPFSGSAAASSRGCLVLHVFCFMKYWYCCPCRV